MTMNPSYTLLRPDVLELVRGKPDLHILDVGCSTGINGAFLKQTMGARVVGIDYDEEYCHEAQLRLDKVFHADLNRQSLKDLLPGEQFDCILFADILEHLMNPWQVLTEGASLLRPDGSIIVSIPNIGHYSTLVALGLHGKWPSRPRGIHDHTHLRFFTRGNLIAMYDVCGLQVEYERRNLRLFERGTRLDRWKVMAALLDFPLYRRFFVFQYIHLLRRQPS